MVKVYVVDGPDFGPVITEVKGIRGGREWVANEVQAALCYTPGGIPHVDWASTDIPDSLRRKIVVCIQA